MSSKESVILKKMIRYCEDIDYLMQKYGSDYSTFQSDISFQYSVSMCIIQIGELVTRLSEQFIRDHKNIPWHEIRAMRNLHAHDYDRVDLSIVWNTVMEDIPDLKNALSVMIKKPNL